MLLPCLPSPWGCSITTISCSSTHLDSEAAYQIALDSEAVSAAFPVGPFVTRGKLASAKDLVR